MKDPEKMSHRELRVETKLLRKRVTGLENRLRNAYQRGHTEGYRDGWKACAEKIIEEVKKA